MFPAAAGSKPREDGSTPPFDFAIPVFGYQNHISIDRGFGFMPLTTHATAHEGRRRAMSFPHRIVR
ncbi:MAG: hypothetical protein ACREDT_05975 [Methylocella sp.]